MSTSPLNQVPLASDLSVEGQIIDGLGFDKRDPAGRGTIHRAILPNCLPPQPFLLSLCPSKPLL